MAKRKILFVINQFFKGGAETALLNLFRELSPKKYEIDFMIFDQIDLKDTISLIPDIPEWIHVINIASNEGRLAFVKKVYGKLQAKITGVQYFRHDAIMYLRERKYDVAISYGEWFSSAIVACYVQAHRKYVWIHADMDKASFLHPDIMRFQNCFDRFIFVSKLSMKGAIEKYPEIAQRCCVVHNMIDRAALQEKSRQDITLQWPTDGLPVLLTVANIRPEKNHLRQVAVMKTLFERGLRFHWINAGSLARNGLVEEVRTAVLDANLSGYFHLVGAVDNPYVLMKHTAAVCVLSDHEAWSMVITEAKALCTPVIATKTSGALEQIVDGANGLLCDFSVSAIADKIEMLLKSQTLAQKIIHNLQDELTRNDTLSTLEPLLDDCRQKILYVFDDINYMSGARNAALLQIAEIEKWACVDVFSIQNSTNAELRNKYIIVHLSNDELLTCLAMPLHEVLGNGTRRQKTIRVLYAILARIGLEMTIPDCILKHSAAGIFEKYDTVCVISEASKLRKFVSELKKPKKVQWIHTDYAAWRNLNGWTRSITRRDKSLYKKYDAIVCLNELLKERFLQIYPKLKGKVIAIHNPIPHQEIIDKAKDTLLVPFDKKFYNFITIGRFEWEKRYDRLVTIASELKKRNFQFRWYFVGDGALFESTQELVRQKKLQQEIILTGMLTNPYPLLKNCDCMILFSEYEGTPVTIDEAKVLGVPVIANDVGGIKEQISYSDKSRILDLSKDAMDIVAEQIITWCKEKEGKNEESIDYSAGI